MKEYWLQDNCTSGTSFGFTWKEYPAANLRRDFLEKYHPKWNGNELPKKPYPFIHGYAGIQADIPNYKIQSWGLDPLVIPILKRLNSIPGVRTLFSCQGHDEWSPTISLTTDLEGAQKVKDSILWKSQSFRNRIILSYVGLWEESGVWEEKGKNIPRWNILFFDLLSLIEFNRDVCGVSIKEQLTPPKWFPEMGKALGVTEDQHREDMERLMTVAPMPTVEEIEFILSQD